MDIGTILLILAALLCYILVRRMGKGRNEDSRSAKLMKKYAVLTEENLTETPDEELVEAVVSHVLSRATEARHPDPVKELACLPQPFTVVYSIWAVCKELARGDYAALTHTATRHVVDVAVDALPVVGAPTTAQALSALRDAHTDKQDTADLEKAFHLAVESECPLSLCATYIRDHIPALLGEEDEEASVALPQAEETADEI